MEIRNLRKKLSLSQSAFGRFANDLVQTIARWESSTEKISGPIVTLANPGRISGDCCQFSDTGTENAASTLVYEKCRCLYNHRCR